MVKDHSDSERKPAGTSCTLPMLCCLLTENEGGKQESDLFNDALNTFHLRLYGVGISKKRNMCAFQ